jgi:hypothetical protein
MNSGGFNDMSHLLTLRRDQRFDINFFTCERCIASLVRVVTLLAGAWLLNRIISRLLATMIRGAGMRGSTSGASMRWVFALLCIAIIRHVASRYAFN